MVSKLTSIDHFNKMLEDNESIFVFKHSETCPISASAFDIYNNFLYERDMDGYYLIVQEERDLSNYIESEFGIKHESPQALYFQNGEIKWSKSHQDITLLSLADAEE
ncbi:bacillithiol system redox-active protein YtxJ [Abyssicoccus albus]|jgi:bacillithiol system protein YtxJ|uniref:Bacillithiol system protein YtxJ n=1 Tax=Abyssicoccus albus TaxID=1817405 RepID=A0A1Q1G2X4_9BACL|nr:bacillithiol system redox-active protein YtxJ [Abyssicoccus albus]AQL56715.1 bacillithiol system protein YtxJ [Abyssicoccus albus]RPF57462.1 bacillithiol system protein YtxJ [Abyssicoccus albus]